MVMIAELDWQSNWIKNSHGKRAYMRFSNGYGASVVNDLLFCPDAERPYEIMAIIHKGNTSCQTPITKDGISYLTEDEANDILAQIEALPRIEKR